MCGGQRSLAARSYSQEYNEGSSDLVERNRLSSQLQIKPSLFVQTHLKHGANLYSVSNSTH